LIGSLRAGSLEKQFSLPPANGPAEELHRGVLAVGGGRIKVHSANPRGPMPGKRDGGSRRSKVCRLFLQIGVSGNSGPADMAVGVVGPKKGTESGARSWETGRLPNRPGARATPTLL